MFWIFPYDPRVPHPRNIISKNYKFIENHPVASKIFPRANLVVGSRRLPNLGEILSPTLRKGPDEPGGGGPDGDGQDGGGQGGGGQGGGGRDGGGQSGGETTGGRQEGGLLVGVPGRIGGQTSHQVKLIVQSKIVILVEVFIANTTRNQTNVMYAATLLRLKVS